MNNESGSTFRLLLDQGVSHDAVGWLAKDGFDCLHVSDIGMREATDTEIIAWAADQNRTVVTLDADFHAHLAVTGAVTPSVIRIRMEGLRGEAIANLLRRVLEEFGREIEAGCLVTVKERKTTCHRLPLGGRG